MQVPLTKKQLSAIDSLVTKGKYASPAQLVKKSVTLLLKHELLKSELEEAMESSKRGETVDAFESLDRIGRKHDFFQ